MIKLYNTLSGQIEDFRPRQGKQVNLFVCGPTVYDYSHLGHARTYVAFDMFANYLKSQGYNVFYLQNITDIDDKIIVRAKEQNISWRELSRKFEKEYFADIKAIKIKSVKKYARATEHIKEIISQVKRLLEKGVAYQAEDGIYYDVSKFTDYGKLSRRDGQIAEASFSRIDESVVKKNKADFCLWKLSQPGDPSWHSPYGNGRPGWHIEDTAITEKYFGAQYDIHGGARDLIFPHHEAEIAQMEAISGQSPLVKYWMHTGFLTINGQKMSKSIGNFTTISDFLKNNSPEVLRFIIFSSHYRSPIDFKDTAVQEAKANIEKLQTMIVKLGRGQTPSQLVNKNNKVKVEQGQTLLNLQARFWGTLEDDFNTPQAKAVLFEIVALTNEKIAKNEISKTQVKEVLQFLQKVNKIFQFLDFKKESMAQSIPNEVIALANKREEKRKEKNWAEADVLRKQIETLDYEIEDTPQGPKLNKI